MASQTTLGSATRDAADEDVSPAAGVRENVAELAHDIVSLGELQGQLFLVDVRDGTQQMRLPLALMIVGMVLALGSVPVLLQGLSQGLSLLTGLEMWASLIIVALGTAAIAAALLWSAWRIGNQVVTIFARSKQELAENIRWIKRALLRSGRRRAS